MNSNSNLTEIDDLIAKITQSIDRLEDCIEWPEYEPSPNEDQRRESMDGSVYDPESRDTSISGLSASATFNCFPSNCPASCCDTFFLILPRTPYPRSCGPCEAEQVRVDYFCDAMNAFHLWIDNCKGSTLVILTDTWPLPPSGEKLPRISKSIPFHRRRFMHFRLSSSILHTQIGSIVKQKRLKCHISLFTGRGGVTKLPVMSGGNWSIGW
jgi:hypothetical protein